LNDLQYIMHDGLYKIKKIARTLIFFVAQQKAAVIKNQHSDNDKEIRCHQPSSIAATSRCPVTQTLPSNFLSVMVARAMAVLVAVVVAVAGGAVKVALALAVAVLSWGGQGWWWWQWRWRWRWQGREGGQWRWWWWG
jgi:hypothetical protein